MEPINETEKLLYSKLVNMLSFTDYWKDDSLLQCALTLIPADELRVRATVKYSSLPESNNVDIDDLLLLELLEWFKEDFFKWLDAPKCDTCDVVTEKKGFVTPTQDEAKWDARTVEHFECPKCEKTYRFPRFNHPRKLLETRRGRCGEWANCFTLLCIALGYDSRFVIDWTDHVWTEVYSHSNKQWLHCDPCENVCDKPLMYEVGWNKKLKYVIAIGRYEIQDVTWRYTRNFEDVLKRRNVCREEFLLHCILTLQEKLQKSLSPPQLKELKERRARELAEFLSPAQPDSGNYSGRTSGSLSWRLARGEISFLENFYVFKLNTEEIKQKYFHIKYSCALDKYMRVSSLSVQTEDWKSFTFSHANMFRKVEKDWKVSYLAHAEGFSRGSVAWKFDFRDTNLVISTVKLNLHSRTFNSGTIKWLLFPNSEDDKITKYSPEVCPLETTDLKGNTNFILKAELTGGDSWQHAQLFRQSLDSTAFPFEVEIHFIEKMSSP
ncbi:peptide-N(4)-(N-acetyl-beta-glucosaminyl)asparagine amidase-like isoform X2 [Argiope bruennichi]|uniref:peptide-N(4)-(N-acetyl-beta- glucosaminyl)asparagine amidase-like isoform X2 n=1 Tax=Argiope bruennichi TaxID=94029 RepID=UPI0024959495|nr:peptide-N(4)-(N-acetyl-beta-glucosaminyl)asparagine amidase-like isoform X2 [Argiope bruennichi]